MDACFLQAPGGEWEHACLDRIQQLMAEAVECGEYAPSPDLSGVPLVVIPSHQICQDFCLQQGLLQGQVPVAFGQEKAACFGA